MNEQVWIGLIGVKPKTDACECLKPGEAGYLTAVSPANGSNDFQERTSSALEA
jgi:hypothetical protein